MSEEFDYMTVIRELQTENEILRAHMKAFIEARQVVDRIPSFLEAAWQKIAANKMQALLWLLIIYWATNTMLMFYDRVRRG